MIENTSIEIVNEYKYLGITISNTGSFNKAILMMANKAMKVLFALMGRIARLKYPPCHTVSPI